MQYLQQEILAFTTSNIVESTLPWSGSTLTAGTFIVGQRYTIVSVGTTNFTLIGAASNTIGVVFVATGIGTGTGTAIVTYNVGDYALFGYFIYKSVSAHTNKSPDANTGVYWVKWSISNKQAMLDLSANSKSYVNGGNLVVTFPQNRMIALAIGNYEAETILIEILALDGTTVMWSYTTPNSTFDGVYDWWTWMYAPYGYSIDRAIKINLGVTNGTTVRVTFNKLASATRSACGYLIGGTPVDMGCTLHGVNYGFHSYALKQTDDFGTLSIIKRAVQDKVDFNTILPSSQLMTSKRNIKAVYNDIIAFIIDERDNSPFENMITLGTIESSSVVLNDGEFITMSWNIVEAL